MIFADYFPDTSISTQAPPMSHISTYLYMKLLLNKGSFIPKQHKLSQKLNAFQRSALT